MSATFLPKLPLEVSDVDDFWHVAVWSNRTNLFCIFFQKNSSKCIIKASISVWSAIVSAMCLKPLAK